MTPTERLLTILRFVGEANDHHTVADSEVIREKMKDVYAGDITGDSELRKISSAKGSGE